MKLNNAKINGRIQSIEIDGGVITKIASEPFSDADFDLNGKMLIPGMIDIHVHGWGGADTMDGDLSELKLKMAEIGTTSFLPTTMTASIDNLEKVTSAPLEGKGANALGYHLEGPFLALSRAGAQDPDLIIPGTMEHFRRFSNAKMITVAPEIEGNIEFIKNVTKEGVHVAIGHSDCDYDTAMLAIKAGADSLTHTFNCMPPLLHRAPGPIGAGINNGVYAQLISDGLHVHPASVLALYKMYGADHVALISDSLSCAGQPDGEYFSGGLPITVKNGEARLTYGGNLAGSTTSLFNCMKRAASFGIPFEDALKMATETPAKLLGVKKGVIAEGYDADLLILDENLEIEHVIINGKLFK